jgi:hypothetical protein
VDRLRADLAAASRATTAEAPARRDRLARTLADVEAVEATRATLDDELAHVREGADEVAAALAQIATGVVPDGSAALERLRRTTDLARAPLDEADLRARAARAVRRSES